MIATVLSAARRHRAHTGCGPTLVGISVSSVCGAGAWQSVHSPSPSAGVTGPHWRAATPG